MEGEEEGEGEWEGGLVAVCLPCGDFDDLEKC